MCGIAGGLGNLQLNTLNLMIDVINHRGPDNISTYSNGSLHFAHARLSIIDVTEKSNQPIWDHSSRFCIIFNGEIYNYKKLRNELLIKGYIFQTDGDAEVILNLYKLKGKDAFKELEGIFALAIWDSENEELVIARDKFGVKPLYYTQTKEGFFFSSEIKSLIQIPSVEKKIDLNVLHRTLVFLWNPGNNTLIRNIKKLGSATYCSIQLSGEMKSNCYWKYPHYSPDND